MQRIIITCLGITCCLLCACSTTHLPIHAYQPSVQQGNIFTQEMVDQVKIGMSKGQVVDTMGYPTLANDFEDNHWPYVYTYQKNGGKISEKRLDLYFRNGHLISKDYQSDK